MDNHSSTVREFSAKALIKQEAGAWIVQIDQGPLSSQQISDLQQWMAQSSFHRDYLEKLAHNWDAMATLQQLAPLFPISEPSAAPATIMQRLQQWLTPPVWGSALASLALLVIIMSSQPPNQFETSIGQQAQYQLPDGSSLSLNTNSQVRIDYSADRRAVHLLRGEAHFDVAKNPERPFMVYAGQGMVWAVGTAFNVRYVADPQDSFVDVTVTQGTVKVFAQLDQSLPVNQPQQNSTPAANQALEQFVQAGASVQYSEVIQPTDNPPPTALEQKLAWQQGALIFKGETLQQAVKEISRYTHLQLIIVDPAIRQMRVGGHYKTNDIDSLLASLGRGFGIQIDRVGNNQIHLSASTSAAP
jgi:transmembrane sensor